MRSIKTEKLSLEKFQVAKIKNPSFIFGGDGPLFNSGEEDPSKTGPLASPIDLLDYDNDNN